MSIKEYQEFCKTTAIYDDKYKMIYPTLGLSSEVGEFCGKYKKILRDKHGDMTSEDIYEMEKELGDIYWYLQAIATDLGLDSEEIIKKNIEKLSSRKERNVISGSGDNR